MELKDAVRKIKEIVFTPGIDKEAAIDKLNHAIADSDLKGKVDEDTVSKYIRAFTSLRVPAAADDALTESASIIENQIQIASIYTHDAKEIYGPDYDEEKALNELDEIFH